MLVLMSMKSYQQEITIECVKRHHASSSCHYNFLIDGEKYRYIDRGCKEKRDDLLKKAQAGKLALAKDWKIECPVKKPK
jgi:hypothetical protein